MSHFAKVNPENIVVNITVCEEEFFETFVDDSPGQWIQTSYNTLGGVHYDNSDPEVDPFTVPSADQTKALRGNFAKIGGSYIPEHDIFVDPKPYNSWTLDVATATWVAPVAKPEDENNYEWDEENQQWVMIDLYS